MSTRGRITGLALVTSGVATILVAHWMMAFWVPNEATQGVVQRIFYVHVPAAWTMFIAVGIVALASAVYLWLKDERADAAAVAAGSSGAGPPPVAQAASSTVRARTISEE